MEKLSNSLHSVSMRSPYLWVALLAGPVYVIYTVIWRLYFSPIAHFPGPKLAAATSLYEAYYNIWLGGKYIWRVKQMHDTYGPIVRISPTDLHVLDPEFFETLYPSSTSKRKAHKVSKFFGLEDSLFSTIDHDLHRMRRTALLPFFSTAYTKKLQPDIEERLGVMLARMKGFKDTDEPINASCMYAAFTNDIMQILAFGECAYKLETPGFDSTERDASISGAMAYHILKRILWFNNVLMVIPESIVESINPSLGSYMRQKRRTREQVEKLATQTSDDWASRGIAPVFQAVRESSKLPPQEKSIDRLAQDAQMLLMAGTLTTASTLEHMTYWLLDNPIVLRKLKDELVTVMPSIDDVGKIPLSTLDSLPYLTAIIKEGARLIYGNSLPHFRQNPDGTLTLTDKERGKTWVIPAGTSVGMTSVLLHHNEDHFPDSYDFVPERWLGEEGKKLERYMVAFGKGGRICLGMNQAFGILRLVLAQMWRLWASEDVKIGDEIGKIALYNTTAEDVEVVGDFFIAAYHKPQGVEFKVHSI